MKRFSQRGSAAAALAAVICLGQSGPGRRIRTTLWRPPGRTTAAYVCAPYRAPGGLHRRRVGGAGPGRSGMRCRRVLPDYYDSVEAYVKRPDGILTTRSTPNIPGSSGPDTPSAGMPDVAGYD
jgi:hypothetical protein